MPFFSVIIPTYNRATLLREALDSVFAQSFTDYEVIVVDDGSTDETTAVVSSYGGRIRYFQQQNQGPGAARNFGVREAIGDYIAFLDSDDLWFPWTLKAFQGIFQRQSKVSFLAGQIVNYKTRAELDGVVETEPSGVYYDDYLTAAQQPNFAILTCSSVAVCRSEMLKVGGFSEQNINGEDSDLWLKLGVVARFAWVEAPVICGYRRHANSAVASALKTYQGMCNMITNEVLHSYPGGLACCKARRAVVTRHVRPASIGLLRSHEFSKAVDLYRATFRWHCRMGRWKYLFGFPLVLILERARMVVRR